jgi:hypothetical protein
MAAVKRRVAGKVEKTAVSIKIAVRSSTELWNYVPVNRKPPRRGKHIPARGSAPGFRQKKREN